jgi:hypothetical protein
MVHWLLARLGWPHARLLCGGAYSPACWIWAYWILAHRLRRPLRLLRRQHPGHNPHSGPRPQGPLPPHRSLRKLPRRKLSSRRNRGTSSLSSSFRRGQNSA